MKIYNILFLLLISICYQSKAHNAKIATITLRDSGAGWFVEMNFAQAGVDATMIEIHGDQKLQNLERKDYQDLIVDYIKSNFNLVVDGEKVELASGGIMLGSHQTDLKFVLPKMPLQPREAQVYIPMFGNTYNHTNLFRIYRGGKSMTKFFLSDDNDFKVDIKFTPKGIIEVKRVEKNDYPIFIASGSILLCGIVIFALYRRRAQVQLI